MKTLTELKAQHRMLEKELWSLRGTVSSYKKGLEKKLWALSQEIRSNKFA